MANRRSTARVRMSVFRPAILSLLAAAGAAILTAFPATGHGAGTEIFLQEDPEVYLVIDKLQGMGLLPGIMSSDRGLEAREVAREAEKAGVLTDTFLEGMVRFLSLTPPGKLDFRLRATPGYSRYGAILPNSHGLPVPEDGGVRLGGFVRAEPWPWLGLQARGDYIAGGDEGSTSGRVEEVSLRLGWPYGTLEAGRFSVWWGPGRHGSLLLSTNAPPLWGARIRNPRPIPMPWIFKFLGTFQYDLFAARLEEDRPIPHSVFSGTRVAFKPSRHLEIGFSQVMHFGGDGHGGPFFSEWWDAFTPRETGEAGGDENILAGFDVSVWLPFRVQPVQLYLDAAGEDTGGYRIVPHPTKWAYVAGLFLPSIAGTARLDLRVEYAATHVGDHGAAWYVHPPSNEGYAHRYLGEILGHHMGTDAQDLFLQAHLFLLPSSYLEFHLDLTDRYYPGPATEEEKRHGLGFVGWLTKNVRAEIQADFLRVDNAGGVPGNDLRDGIYQVSVAYQYR